MTKLETKPLPWFKVVEQVRKLFDEAELRLLGASLKKKQFVPLLARTDGTILDGERRWRAATAVGMATLDVIITEEKLSESQVKEIQLLTAMQRADLTGFEKWTACAELMCMNVTWQMKDLAEHLHLDPAQVTRILSPSKCSPAWQEALKAGTVSISDCYAASKLPERDQAGLLALKLSGASRDTLEAAGKKTRTAATPAVKVARVKCLLPSGVQIVVSGDGISLEDATEALGEAIKEMKRARDLGYTAKTFASAMADKAKKG